MTLIPKDLYINGQGKVKLTLCLAKGKHLYDKRDVMQEKTAKLDKERLMKNAQL
jgi:SsrA-binding protein